MSVELACVLGMLAGALMVGFVKLLARASDAYRLPLDREALEQIKAMEDTWPN